ncbi:MAG TPA: hypothetical protein VGU63_13530 [Candidatus Acidoferrales bacterium]|nr:hypothetical protein [Candidatus Acidoferrales bacterium]
MGYELAGLALAFVVLYFLLVALVLRLFEPQPVVVARYEPPTCASPAVAAWLLERGALARAMASAIVNMAAKAYLKVEQNGDLYSVTQLGPDVSLDLEPEEDALARTLFKGYDCFDFDEPTPQLREALAAFHCALKDTTYFSEHTFLSVPAWILSVGGIFLALVRGNFFPNADRITLAVIILAFGSFITAVRTLPGTLQKIASRLPGSTAPRRPWSSADSMTFTLFVGGVGGVAFLALRSTPVAALLTAGFVAVNTIFYHSLQGPTAAGRKAVAQLREYKKFLAEVDADRISRMNACETTPSELTKKQAYAIAFHLDLGWGEQFVGSIADLVDRSEIFGKTQRAVTGT